jgi:acyl-coenzyme A thioesterase PaaI-like protein
MPENTAASDPTIRTTAAAPAEAGRRPSWRWHLFLRLLSAYPPFLGAGIRVRPVRHEGEEAVEARMRLAWWNRNAVGTHFGGSLYSMCDPFFMLILRQKLGRGYTVWDKAATIRFRRPGRGTVRALFSIPEQRVREIRAAAGRGERFEPTFTTTVVDGEGQVVAEVEKLLYVRRQDPPPPAAG